MENIAQRNTSTVLFFSPLNYGICCSSYATKLSSLSNGRPTDYTPYRLSFCREQSDDQSSETETHSLPPDVLGHDSLGPDSLGQDSNLLAERFSPDKMPQLTQDQQKALAGESDKHLF